MGVSRTYVCAIGGCDVGMWLSLVERLVRDEEVAGSNPVIPTILSPPLSS